MTNYELYQTTSANTSHVQKVRLLYKSCLKLHRGLPVHLKAIGDSYVKAEFKAHKKAEPQQVQFFMEAWAKYAIDLSKQMGVKSLTKEKADKLKVGANFREADLDNFSDEQLAQLYELFSEAKKPIDTEKDPHLAS